ncbi:MAG: dihydroorotate oxidase [Patescibacteria group bacterium]
METPFFDPNKTYYENWEQGPFGAFIDPKDSLGKYPAIPFGIAAGPLLNARFMKAAMLMGFDHVVYKTVRTREKKSNQWPNVVSVDIKGDLSIEQAKKGVTTKEGFAEPLAITNSFGNPCYPVDVWQQDIAELVEWAKDRKGQRVSAMIEGTRWDETYTDKKFLEDWVLAAQLMQETKVPEIEANFSCPNEGNLVKTLLCYDTSSSRRIAEAIKNKIGNVPLIIKISYFEDQNELEYFVKELGTVVDGFSAINTIQTPVYNAKGKQALPGGDWRLKSGICGTPIKWAGLDMVQRLKSLREKLKMNYQIIGVGGVMSSDDYHEYRSAGADVVMSATGSMWNPHLAVDIKKTL